MVEFPAAPESITRDVFVATPADAYELIDFGNGRKLERWGEYLVESPDREAHSVPAHRNWNADWIYIPDVGVQGHWEPPQSDLPREWPVTVRGQQVICRLEARGQVGLRGRDIPCAAWVSQRIEGCYDLDVINVLHLFGGNGFVSAHALQAGASVIHVDSNADMLSLAHNNAGSNNIEYVQENVMGYVEDLLRLGVQTKDGRVLPAGVAACWYDETEFLQTSNFPLTAAQLEERLDIHMISLGAAEEPARALAEFPREQQDFVLHWAAIVARTSSGMALNFVLHVCPALRLMDADGVEAWLLACMDVYDRKGLHSAVAAFRDMESFAREHKDRATRVGLDGVVNVLEMFVHGLNGRRLKIECSDTAYTDTETIFLPASIARYTARDDNFQLYKAMVVHQWAQTWFGTWRIEVQEVFGRYPDGDKAIRCFHALETLRLDAKTRDTLPGVYRYIERFRDESQIELDANWQAAAAVLALPGASVVDGQGTAGCAG